MPMSIMCSKGCGYAITVTDEALKEMQELGSPIDVSHGPGECPGTPGKDPKYQYDLTVMVRRTDLDANGEPSDEGVLLVQNGGKVKGDLLSEVFDSLTDSLSEQWQKVAEMRHVAEQG